MTTNKNNPAPTRSDTASHYPPQQKQLFPVEIVDTYPAHHLGTADLKYIGRGKDGKEYAIKRVDDSKNGFIPASEFFCYNLARRIGLAVPHYEILQLENNTLAFGSLWEGGVLGNQIQKTAIILSNNPPINGGTASFFGKAYAFDLFINNIDRHIGNFLFRDSYSGILAMVFDHSRAWKETGFDEFSSLHDKACNTQSLMQLIKSLNRIDFAQSKSTLADLENIAASEIDAILADMPSQWLTQQDRQIIVKWWGSDMFKQRINTLKLEINRHVMV